MELAQAGNAYFDAQKPWALAKDPEKRSELESVIANSIECIKNLALLASPIIPSSAQKIWHMLGFKSELAKGNWHTIHSEPVPTGQHLAEPVVQRPDPGNRSALLPVARGQNHALPGSGAASPVSRARGRGRR